MLHHLDARCGVALPCNCRAIIVGRAGRSTGGAVAGNGRSQTLPVDIVRARILSAGLSKMHKGRVLVIDDSEITVEAVVETLTENHWQARGTYSGREAFVAMRQWYPEVVVCDLHMPDEDGFDVLNRLRTEDPTLPVIVLTADEDLAAVLKAVREGAFDYVIKAGLDWRPLMLAIDRAMDHSRVLGENRQLTEDLQLANADLEKRVAKRTDELEAAIVELRNRESELEVSQAELRGTNAALVAASAQKNRFLANMSHELRTPLNAIIGFTRIIARKTVGEIDDIQAKNLRMVQQSGEHLLELVNDMLDFQKIESGALNITVSDVDCEALTDNLASTLRPIAEAKGIELELDIGDSPFWLQTDPVRLRQALANLITNAIKYSDSGRIRVTFRHHKTDRAGGVQISVADEGIGIPEDKLESIFEPFHQVDPSDTREHGGAGLGLAIVQKLAELLRGRIEVESELGKGSTFTLIFPANTFLETSPIAPSGTGPMVLVIENNLQALQILSSELASIGFRVHVAKSGGAGLKKAQELKPDAILLDIIMPEMDGWQFLRRMREDPGTADIPVVISSALGDVPEARQLGVVAWLTKPFKAPEFKAVMSRVLHENIKDVLVIEDDPQTRSLLERSLMQLSLRVRLAVSGTTALEAIDDRLPQAVVLDLMLPDVEGIQLLTRLQEKLGEEIPVVVYTGRDLAPAEQELLSSLLVRVITKSGSNSIDGLVDAVREVIDVDEDNATNSHR